MTTALIRAFTIISLCSTRYALALASKLPPSVINLQRFHVERSPTETLEYLSQESQRLGVDAFDAYGDFEKDPESSYLRRFEAELAEELGMEDAVVMPSGGMAQSIALLIHSAATAATNTASDSNSQKSSNYFACHHTSHLLLHENDAYRELLHMEPLILSTVDQAKGISIPPMSFSRIQRLLDEKKKLGTVPSTLILELPHREIGGKVTPWHDILQIREYCRDNNIQFHMDGARLFEATTGYEDKSIQELVSAFDSVYISFYKGLGGMTGAMLLGSNEFCGQARTWLGRFGGNLYTLMPYAVSGWAGFRRQWRLESSQSESRSAQQQDRLLSFQEKKDKLVGLVQALAADDDIAQVLQFDPAIPETNMVHGYISASVEKCSTVLDAVEREHGIRVLFRVRPVPEEAPAYKLGYKAYFEWAIGEANGEIPDDVFIHGWRAVARGLLVEDT